MSPGASLWVRTGAIAASAVVLQVVLSPSQPTARLPWHMATALGVAAGAVLFVLGARRRPSLPRRGGSVSVLVAKHGFFGVWAASEELVWRRVLLGELLTGGAIAALGLSSLAFAFAHPVRRGLHLATGATFGMLYLCTGILAASIAAHWAYNALVGAWIEEEAAHEARGST